MKILLVALLSLVSCRVFAQVKYDCPSYQTATGTEIIFSDENRKAYGFSKFTDKPNIGKGMPYDVLAGKRGKVIGGQSPMYSMYFHEVLLEDCSTVYWYDTNKQLESGDAISAGITFIDSPPTQWDVSNKIIDKMTDNISCHVMPKSEMPQPFFHFHSTEGISVAVVGGDFPGKPVTFRVDKNKAIAEKESLTGANAQALISQIRAGGKTLLVSSYKWPNDYQVIKEYNLSGLIDALDKCKLMVSK